MDRPKRITRQDIIDCVSRLVVKAARELPVDVLVALEKAMAREVSSSAQRVLDILIENARLAKEQEIPICQDTGIDCVFVELGLDVAIDFDLEQAINEGIRKGTSIGLLRASVADPITRVNTGDNTPGVIHVEINTGKGLTITVLPKGCGSENMSALFMLPPSAGVEGIVERIVERVQEAGANPCPPGIIGVGIGGTMEEAALMAKKALLRPIGRHNPREDVRRIEVELLQRINSLGLGPLGLGGRTTALWVSAEVRPCHIASLPVAMNYQCHAARRAKATFKNGRMELMP